MEKSLHDIVTAFPGKRVLIAGDVMLDDYIWGEVRRISPEAPVPVFEIGRRTRALGGAANAAANVIALEGEVFLCGVVGPDRHGEWLTQELNQRGVDTEGLLKGEGRHTTTKTRIVAHGQQLLRLDDEVRAHLSSQLERELLSWSDRYLVRSDACLLSDYAKGVVSHSFAEHFIGAARQAGKPVIVDPKGTDYAKYRGAAVVKPNIHEAERFSNLDIRDETSLLKVCFRMLEDLENASLLLTRGHDGMTLLRPELEPIHILSVANKAANVIGAGDTVASTLAMALAAGCSLEQAAYLANLAAGTYVEKTDRAAVTLSELTKQVTNSFPQPLNKSKSGYGRCLARTTLSPS
jgi:D-beta-D-heptose 7-phosphate kinase/D-beta-D-heptose 1-phosphate adenosyltransferase